MWTDIVTSLFRTPNITNYSIVLPAVTTPSRYVPEHIVKPYYFKDGKVRATPIPITIKNNKEIEKMKASCRIASSILKNVEKIIKIGVTTDEIDEFVHNECIKKNVYPSPLNYKGFPKSVCTSVNNVVCHGIPDTRKLIETDIINVDITVYHNGFHGDCSKTFLLNNVDDQAKELVAVTEECLMKAISICGPEVPFKEIGSTIESVADNYNLSIIPCFIGHGIGKNFHELPDIIHIGNDIPGVMKSGMTFTIEPILTTGNPEIGILEDKWTAITMDSSRTAQAEHTILINENGCTILTDQH